MEQPEPRRLLAVLANPPLTSGERTLSRVRLAARLLGFADVQIANLFALPSHSTGGIAALGQEQDGWLTARERVSSLLDGADAVLLAYGCTEPTGSARLHHRAQVDWLRSQIGARGLRAWRVGDVPRHPSRWQRWTWRQHPDLAFEDGLARCLVMVAEDPFELPTKLHSRGSSESRV